MPITKEQQSQIEYELFGFYGRVELRCDGHNIVASVQAMAPLKQAIWVYIDGEIKGEWMRGENEIARKFHRETKHFGLPKKMREAQMKAATNRCLSKEFREQCKVSATKTFSLWRPYWTSTKAFIRHIRKTCTEIEVVKIGYGS